MSRLVIAHGVRHVEDSLLAELDLLLGESARDPRLLALPIRVVVPSRSLKQHLAATLIRRRGRAAAGVVVQTLRALASEICQRQGEVVAAGGVAFEVLVRRHGAAEDDLSRHLQDFDDG